MGYSAFLRPQRFEFGKKYKFRLCGYGLFSYLSKVCFAAIGACTFSGAFSIVVECTFLFF